jgi:hypothetical protein
MIHVKAGNLIAVSTNGRYYYVLVLKSFLPSASGHWCFVFHKTSEQLLCAADLLNEGAPGFYELVDFIWAKRQKRLIRIAEKIDITSFYTGSSLQLSVYRCITDTALIQRIHQKWSSGIRERIQGSI